MADEYEKMTGQKKSKGSAGRESAYKQRSQSVRRRKLLTALSPEQLQRKDMETQPVPRGDRTKFSREHDEVIDEWIRRNKNKRFKR